MFAWDPRDDVSVLFGVDAYSDYGVLNDDLLIGAQTPFGSETQVFYEGAAGYAQVLYDNPIVNVAVGARYERHSEFGGAFVPRVALTKVIDRFHAKLLYANAFRAPGIENYNLGGDVQAEFTTVVEAEVGYQFTESLFLSANVFDLTIRQPLIYGYDPVADAELYFNATQTGSRGVELELRAKYGWGSATLGYSFYTPAGKNQVAAYDVAGQPNLLLGFGAHKVTLSGGINILKNLSFNPSLVYVSDRFGHLYTEMTTDPTTGALGYTTLIGNAGSNVLVNAFLTYRNLGVKGLDAQVGVHNLLDQANLYIQPYAGSHAPWPGPSRELVARVSYQVPF
jgi:hypothetical protein